jgi:hypothetical protein
MLQHGVWLQVQVVQVAVSTSLVDCSAHVYRPCCCSRCAACASAAWLLGKCFCW